MKEIQLTRDYNKGISSITYDQFGNPFKVTFGNKSSIEYVYSVEAFELQKGCDGKMYEHLDIKGSYHGYSGTFEFIKDEKGIITHRFFNINRP